jgi:protein-arginine kinase activator protein McsA
MNCNICTSIGYSHKARICIQLIERDKSTMLYVCKRCAKMFDDPLCSCKRCSRSNKKMLERTVRPGCSNTRSGFQQHGVPLND